MIDVTKCIGCRKGISLFIKRGEGKYVHLDMFATPEAGASFTCENSDVLEPLIHANGDKGTLLPNEDFQKFMTLQEEWWETMLGLAYEVFETKEAVTDFMNTKEGDIRIYELPNLVIETHLLKAAEEKGIVIDQDEHYGLIKFQDNER